MIQFVFLFTTMYFQYAKEKVEKTSQENGETFKYQNVFNAQEINEEIKQDDTIDKKETEEKEDEAFTVSIQTQRDEINLAESV